MAETEIQCYIHLKSLTDSDNNDQLSADLRREILVADSNLATADRR